MNTNGPGSAARPPANPPTRPAIGLAIASNVGGTVACGANSISKAEMLYGIATMPEGRRRTTLAEAADAMGCSEGNVKSQSARGLDRLREAFPQHARPQHARNA